MAFSPFMEGAAAEVSPTSIQTTLEEIMDGKFPSATDKLGTGGVVVQVENLTVLLVFVAPDGDWLVPVTDGKVAVFVTEIVPRDQGRLKMPRPGQVITEIGTPYCDQPNAKEIWHGSTCWEIHPVVDWTPYTPVPEFPAEYILLLAATASGYFVLRFRKNPR